MLTKNEIASIIEESVVQSPFNNFNSMNNSEEPMWEKPLVGFASGEDPYFKKFKPTVRPYHGHQDYCLFYKDGSCGACMFRCPVNAITREEQGCGLCQTEIPCQNCIPK